MNIYCVALLCVGISLPLHAGGEETGKEKKQGRITFKPFQPNKLQAHVQELLGEVSPAEMVPMQPGVSLSSWVQDVFAQGEPEEQQYVRARQSRGVKRKQDNDEDGNFAAPSRARIVLFYCQGCKQIFKQKNAFVTHQSAQEAPQSVVRSEESAHIAEREGLDALCNAAFAQK